jgi:hypothetical protein
MNNQKPQSQSDAVGFGILKAFAVVGAIFVVLHIIAAGAESGSPEVRQLNSEISQSVDRVIEKYEHQ